MSHALSTWASRGNAIMGSAQMINSTLSGYGDRTGNSISLSKDGMTLAVGSPQHTFTGTSDLAGKVGIYSWNGSTWNAKGSPLYAEAIGDYFGSAISINADGTALVVGAYGSSANGFNAGQVRVFTFSGSSWTQMGVDIEGTMLNQKVGASVDISDDGKTIIVGVSDITNTAQYSGEVRVYIWNGTTWLLKGSAISGEAMDDYFGTKVSISADGNIIAASAPNSDTPASEAGSVRIFSWDGSDWVQQGNNINGRAASNFWGSSLKLNASGSQIAIGAPYYDNSGTITGLVVVYTWTGSAWTQKGADILGEGDQYLGNDIALSSSGDTIAIGANGATIVNSTDGAVKTYRWSGTVWESFVDVLSGTRSEDNFGKSVSLSANGKILAVGAPGPDNLLNDGGRAQTYFLTCTGVTIAQQPISQTICGSSLVTISVSATGANLSYSWSNGETTQSIQTNTVGNYNVTVTNFCASAVSNTVTVTSRPSTQITTQPTSQAICNGNSTTLSVAGTGFNISYLWSNGAITPTISTSVAGTYLATVSGACGNLVSNSVQISNGIPTSITGLSSGTVLTQGNTTNIGVTATGTSLQYLWSNGATTPLLTNVSSGEYRVTVTGTCGGIVSDWVRIGELSFGLSVSGFTHTQIITQGLGYGVAGASIGKDGKIYVADLESHSIKVYILNGTNYVLSTSFGGEGDGPSNFSRPYGVYVHTDGKIYVADYDNNRISVWNFNGTTYSNVTTFGSSGSANDQFNLPLKVNIAPDGKIYVADYYNHRISVWTNNGGIYSNIATFGSFGSTNDKFNYPSDIAFTSDGKILVSDYVNNRVSVWSVSGNVYTPITTFINGSGLFSNETPWALCVANDKKIYVAHLLGSTISVWTQSGNNFTKVNEFGDKSALNRRITSPYSVQPLDDNRLLIANAYDSNVSIWRMPAAIFYFQATFDVTAPATFTGTTATLTWPTIPGAVTYCIRISKDKSMGTGVKTVCGLTGNTYSYNPNNPNGRSEAGEEEYFWQVLGLDSAGNESQWSEVQKFTLNFGSTSVLSSNGLAKVSIFPNPNAENVLNVENAPVGTIISIINIQGVQVFTQKAEKSTSQIDISSLKQGIYLVQVAGKVFKFVRE